MKRAEKESRFRHLGGNGLPRTGAKSTQDGSKVYPGREQSLPRTGADRSHNEAWLWDCSRVEKRVKIFLDLFKKDLRENPHFWNSGFPEKKEPDEKGHPHFTAKSLFLQQSYHRLFTLKTFSRGFSQ